ncbi:MAG: SH3 domain-containing protein [Bacteroidia bacterium]|nr:SH3 domain-containing protein [Bacteroidia bacterium]
MKIKSVRYFSGRMLLMLLLFCPLFAVSQDKYEVTASSLNVRKSPSGEAAVIGGLSKGDMVNVRELKGSWAEIDYKNGVGYVAVRYIRFVESKKQQEPEKKTEKKPEIKSEDKPVVQTVSGSGGELKSESKKGSDQVSKDDFGISYQFGNPGGGLDFDFNWFDLYWGWYDYKESGVDISSSSFAINVILPFSFNIGFFFIRPVIGIGYCHGKVEVKYLSENDVTKTNAFDFLLNPKVGFRIPKKDGESITIFATYRYDAPNFKFNGGGSWGVGIGKGL